MRSLVGVFGSVCRKLGTWMNAVSGTIVFIMMLVTVTDVVMRFFGKPILGSYEMVSLFGAVVIGFAVPKTSLDRGHISIDFLIERRSETVRRVVFVLTRIPGIALFLALTLYLVKKGLALHRVDQVTLILRIPQDYLVYILAFCCLVECLVLMADVLRAFDGGKA